MFMERIVTAMVPCKDAARAKRWYSEKLGLQPSMDMGEGGAAYTLGQGSRFFLYPTQFAGTAQHTVISFESPDVEDDMKALRAKGVIFEDYDLPGLKTENGLA